MSDNLPQYFDVKTMMNSPWTRSVNLMCHLLRGISYNRLYGDEIIEVPGKHLFDELLVNAQSLPLAFQCDADGKFYDVRQVLVDAFTDIVKLINDYNSTSPTHRIVLGDLFLVARVDPHRTALEELRNGIVDRLELVYTNAASNSFNMSHFCAPFVDIQKDRAELVTVIDAMPDFLRILGTKELIEFFTTTGTEVEKKAVKAATDAGILRVIPKSAISIFVHNGNGKWCCSGNCVASNFPLTWCLEVYVGGKKYCALGSDSDPSCPTTACG